MFINYRSLFIYYLFIYRFVQCTGERTNSYNKRKYLQFTDFLKSAKNVCKSTIYKDFTAPKLLT